MTHIKSGRGFRLPVIFILFALSLASAGMFEPAWGAGDRKFVVVLDPGHGGADAGVIAGQTPAEKQTALDIATAVQSKFSTAALDVTKQLYEIILTRREDTAVSSSARAETANVAHADLYISIHLCQAGGTPAVYYYADTGRPELENGANPALEQARWDKIPEKFSPMSKRLAELLSRRLAPGGGNQIPVMRAKLVPLEGLTMPAAVIEPVCAGNPPEIGIIADALMNAIREFPKNW